MLKCSTHPQYRAKRAPKADCPTCWEMFDKKDIDYQVESFVKHDYLFDGSNYTFSVNDQFVTIDRDRWAGMVADYSHEGGDLTLYQVASKYGIPRKVLEVCFRKYGHFKARPPVTREELKSAIDNEDTEPLVERAIEVAEHGFNVKLLDAKRRELEAENKRLRKEAEERGELVEEFRTVLFELADELPKAKGSKGPKTTSSVIRSIHNPLFDTHLGMSSLLAKDWTVTEYNSLIGFKMIEANGHEVGRIAKSVGGVDTAYMTMGGDIFHAPMGRTEHGRPLQRDLPDRILMREAVLAFKRQIDAVRPYTRRVHIVGIPGNHGHVFDEFLVDFLALHYSEVDDVTVDTGLGSRGYFREGDSLHVLDHGTTFNTAGSTATMAFAERISRRVSGEDFHGSNRIYYYIGHLHHREGKSQAHLEIIRVPTIAGASDYEDMLGFWNHSMTDVFLLDGSGRIKTIERLYMRDLI